MDDRLPRLVMVEYLVHGKSDGICGGVDGRLVVVGNVEYGNMVGWMVDW